VLICYAFHVVLYCCSLYHSTIWLHLNKYLSIYLQLKGAAELAKRYILKKYFASAYPLSKLVQTVIQSQSCFSIVVLGAAGKKIFGIRSLKADLCIMCTCIWPLCLLPVTRRLAAATRLHFSISVTEKMAMAGGVADSVTEQNAIHER